MKALSLEQWMQLAHSERPWVSFRHCRWGEIDLNISVTSVLLRALQYTVRDEAGVFALSDAEQDTGSNSGAIYGFWAGEQRWLLTSPVGEGGHFTPERPPTTKTAALDGRAIDALLSRGLGVRPVE